MRVVVTVVDDVTGDRTDVLIDAAAATPMRTVVDALTRRTGGSALPADAADGDVPFARSGLVDGAVLHIGAQPDAGATTGLVDLLVASGVGSGRSVRLGAGHLRIAVGPDGDTRTGAEAGDTAGLEARIALDGQVEVRLAPVGEPDADAAPGSGSDGPVTATLDDTTLTEPWVPWSPGGALRVAEVVLTVQPVAVVDRMLLRPPDSGQLDFNRPPRLLPPLLTTAFRIPKQPVPPQRSALPWIMVFVPAMFGVVMATVFRSPFYLLFAAMTPIMVIGQSVTARRTGKKSHRRALAEHAERVAAIEEAVDGAVLAERDQRRDDGLDAAALRIAATTPTRRLWERRPTDADHLQLRVGVGDLPSTVTVADDRDLDGLHQEPRWTRGVPVTVPLGEVGVLGVAGPGAWPRTIGRWLLGQLAVTQSPREVQFVVLTSQPAMSAWAWTTWLPHVRPASGQDALALIGADAETIGRRLAELTQILAERRAEREKNAMARRRFSPDIVVVLDGARRLRAMPGVVGLLRDGPACGIRLICIDEEEWQLPEECAATVLHRSPTQLVVRRQLEAPVDAVLADLVDDDWFDVVARALSPLRDTSGSDGQGLVPDSARLLDVLDLPQPTGAGIAARWSTGAATTSAVVGIGIDGAFALDLVRDGPHGLVAGTTGSGKSEFLQTLVASLAVANRPDQMTFVLVDYKGGAAFSVASDLPHTVGLVTDLDQHLVERALRSLRAELTRREHILAASGAKDIEDHEAHLARGGAGEAMPRLVLVIDEFAAMVTELPDFVAGLIGIAQRGRSLGVHLILATQRPGGVVGPDIRANTNLRVALRMTDPSESSDVIDVGDAARIPKSVPGRGYARLGHSSVVPFQSARVGGRWAGEEDPAALLPFVRTLEWRDFAMSPPERPTTAGTGSAATDLSVLVGALGEARDRLGIGALHSPWLPPLPELLPLTEVASASIGTSGAAAASSAGALAFPWAVEDLPDTQAQRAASIDLDRFGHMYIVGAPGSGRSQALRTIAASAAGALHSTDVHLYALDCGNGALASLQALPHCGAVAQRTQVERASRLVERLTREMARRHDVIAAAGAANITEQRLAAASQDRLPHVLFLIDRWENFVSSLGEVDGGSLTDSVQSLLRDGTAAGIHVVISGDRTLLTSRMSTMTDDKLIMRLTDRLDYSLGGINHRQLPASIPPGRAFRADAGTELQVAVLGTDVSGQGQTAAVQALARSVRADEELLELPRIRPFRVDALPKDIDLDAVLELEGAPELRPMLAVTGIGGDEMTLQTVDLATGGGTFVVAGPSRSGRSTMVASMARSLLAGGTELVVLAPRQGPVRDLEGLPGVRGMLTGDDVTEDDVRPLFEQSDSPVVLVVDDGELLIDCSAKSYLRDVVRGLTDDGRGMVLGGNTTGLASGFGGWQVDAKKNRRGALLSPQDTLAGDLVGARIARSAISSRITPGTALVHLGTGLTATLQVPMVTAATRTGSVVTRAGSDAARASVGV